MHDDPAAKPSRNDRYRRVYLLVALVPILALAGEHSKPVYGESSRKILFQGLRFCDQNSIQAYDLETGQLEPSFKMPFAMDRMRQLDDGRLFAFGDQDRGIFCSAAIQRQVPVLLFFGIAKHDCRLGSAKFDQLDRILFLFIPKQTRLSIRNGRLSSCRKHFVSLAAGFVLLGSFFFVSLAGTPFSGDAIFFDDRRP